MRAATTSEKKKGDARAFALEAARLLADRHGEDIVLLDVRGLSQVTDYILVGTGTSDRQMRAVASELQDLGGAHQHEVFRSSADSESTWVVVDFVDLVVHLFEPSTRTYYDVEGLWSDAPPVPWERPDASRAGERNGAAE